MPGTKRIGRRPILVTTFAIVFTIWTGVFAAAFSASAKDLGSWAWTHNGGQTFLSTTTVDKSTYMTRARVQHMDFLTPATTYCGAQAKVGGTLTTGESWTRTFGYESGCNLVMVDETTAPKKYFKGTKQFWGQAYHDGSWAAGKPYVYP